MAYQNYCIVASGVSYTATTTPTNYQLPVNSQGHFTREIRIASTAPVYVKLGDSTASAVVGDLLIQPGDEEVLLVGSDRYISIRSLSGTCAVQISATEGAGFTTFLDLNFLSETLDPRITFTRASSKTFFGSDGRLQTAGNDVWPLEYDPVTLLPTGRSVWEQRTNLLLHSRDMTQGAWGKTDVTANRNQVGIDGAANTACLMTEGVAGNAALTQVVTVAAGATVAASAVLKRGNNDWMRFTVFAGTGGNFIGWFNLATGASGITTFGAPGVSPTIQSTPLGGGFYRVSIVGSLTGITAYTFELASAASNGSVTRVNNATYIVDCAQLEVGSASPIIITGAATATRAADSANIPTAGWMNALAGTYVLDAEFSVGRFFQITGNSNFQDILGTDNAGNSLLVRDATGNILTADLPTSTSGKAVIGYDSSGSYAVGTGRALVSGARMPAFNTTTIVGLGRRFDGAGYLNGRIRSVRFYSTKLPQATAIALST